MSPEPTQNAQPREACSILIAGDDQDPSLREVLTLEGHAVEVAHSGQETLSACATNAYDLLLLDVSLPGPSSLQLISTLEQASPDLEILVVAGHDSADRALHAASRSTIGFLDKPIDIECLLGILARVGNRNRLERENRRLIEEREALIVQLENKNAELERYAYTVSHDLKSPLVTISGFLGHVGKSARAGKWPLFEQDLARISNAVRKMRELIDTLLELSRIGRIANPSEVIALPELVAEVVELVAGQAKERGVEISIADDLPTVLGDRVRLRQVFQNLIDNSIKFAGEQASPRIAVGVRSADGGPLFFVADNGRGIDPGEQEAVFELFHKSPDTAGSGIGLAVVKRIIEVHGGTIWIESKGRGRGATFCFTLAPRITSGGVRSKAAR